MTNEGLNKMKKKIHEMKKNLLLTWLKSVKYFKRIKFNVIQFNKINFSEIKLAVLEI